MKRFIEAYVQPCIFFYINCILRKYYILLQLLEKDLRQASARVAGDLAESVRRETNPEYKKLKVT